MGIFSVLSGSLKSFLKANGTFRVWLGPLLDIIALASGLMVLDLFIYQVTFPHLIYCARAPASLHPKPSLPCFYP